MRIGAVVQARTGSTRLPGKVLRELPWGSGITVLAQVLRRLRRASRIHTVVAAIPEGPEDDALARAAGAEGADVFRGPGQDVLARYHLAAAAHGLDVVVRVTGDCPCLDPQVLDAVVGRHLAHGADYTSNTLERSWPHGLDVEVFGAPQLARAHREAGAPHEREHVTPYLYRSGLFAVGRVEAPASGRDPGIRVTLDTAEDYALLCAVFDALWRDDPFFGAERLLALFARHPWLRDINGAVAHKRLCATLDEELDEALALLARQDLHRARAWVAARRGSPG